jgi:UPF0176 protein
MKNVLYYTYMPISDLDKFRDEHYEKCLELNLLGKIIVASEGINGCVSGDDSNIEKYVEYIKTLGVNDAEIKVTAAQGHNFRKLWVKIKSQIIGTKNWNAKIESKADYIEAEELKKMFDRNEEFYIVDARNNYEYEIGHFRNAVYPNIRKFTEFGDFVKTLDHLKEKKVVTFCTGGIRCELASAYLKEQGFKDVKQLHGGIVSYGKKFGSQHWKGKCFVFDNRVVLDMDSMKNE